MKKDFYLDPILVTASKVGISTEDRGRGDKARKTIVKTIEINTELPVSVLDQLSLEATEEYQNSFFKPDGSLKELGIGKFPITSKFNEHIMILSADHDAEVSKMEVITKKIHGFTASLAPNKMIKCHFKIEVYPETAKVSNRIDEMLLNEQYLCIDGPVQMGIEDTKVRSKSVARREKLQKKSPTRQKAKK